LLVLGTKTGTSNFRFDSNLGPLATDDVTGKAAVAAFSLLSSFFRWWMQSDTWWPML
jgi:hypothetical protein